MNSRLLRHQRGPNPIQWYGIHQIHSDNESDGEAPDGDDLGGHPNIDANMADNDDIWGDAHGFDNIDSSDSASDGDDSDFGGGCGCREYNDVDSEFDGGGSSGGDDFGVFDFCEEEDQPHAIAPVPPVDDEQRDAPPIETFSVAEICDKHDMQILLLRRILLLTRLNLLIPRVIHWISEMRARVAISIRNAIHALLNRVIESMLFQGLRLLVSL